LLFCFPFDNDNKLCSSTACAETWTLSQKLYASTKPVEYGEDDDGGEGGGNENETPTTRDFRDHQAAIYSGCEDVLCAVPPPALRTRMHGRDGFGADVHSSSRGGGLEAAALVAKLTRCREDLFLALWRMGEPVCGGGTAIKEMKVLKSHLETYRGVGCGRRKGVKGAGSGGGSGICVEWEETSERWDGWLGVLLLTLHGGHWICEIGPSYDAAGELGSLLL
jgi:hypothetical protein